MAINKSAQEQALLYPVGPRRRRAEFLPEWLRMLIVRKRLGFVGLVILILIGGAAALAPVLAKYPYAETNFGTRFLLPSWDHPLGTDNLGRDLYSRLLYGSRISLGISFGAVVLAKVAATVIGVISGYYGGWIDKIGQRFIDIWLSLPTLIILVTLMGALGANIFSMTIVIGLANIPGSSRLMRSVVVGVREEPYVEAARSMGAKDSRIMLLHVLPNIGHIIIYSATVTLGGVILIVASLGFLGYGVPAPHPDLGAMLSGDGLTYMRRMPLMAVWPGLTITLVVFAFNILGDALRDIFDPRMRGS